MGLWIYLGSMRRSSTRVKSVPVLGTSTQPRAAESKMRALSLPRLAVAAAHPSGCFGATMDAEFEQDAVDVILHRR
jgi:hypothetical protein